MKYLTINKQIFGIVLAVIMICTSCKKSFFDVNNDPNRATDQNITPELIFPQAASGLGARIASPNIQFLQNWMGYMAAAGDYAILQNEVSYNVDFNFGNTLWGNHYGILFDLYQTKLKAQAKNDSVLAGASMILSARLFQDL